MTPEIIMAIGGAVGAAAGIGAGAYVVVVKKFGGNGHSNGKYKNGAAELDKALANANTAQLIELRELIRESNKELLAELVKELELVRLRERASAQNHPSR